MEEFRHHRTLYGILKPRFYVFKRFLCQVGPTAPHMGEFPWWPAGIAARPKSAHPFVGTVRTQWGPIQYWDMEQILDLDWWAEVPEGMHEWGFWPKEIGTPTPVHDRSGCWIQLNKTHTARIIPLLSGYDASRLARYAPWSECVHGSGIHLPVGGRLLNDSDAVLIYEIQNPRPCTMDALEVNYLVARMAEIHSKLENFATPNTQDKWNQRLNSMEASLKSRTLWRSPHTRNTKGLPRINFDLDFLADTGTGISWIAVPFPLPEFILCEPVRLPSIFSLMKIERQWATSKTVNSAERKEILEIWSSYVPASWANKRSLSTVLGGAWVWRYNAVLDQLLHARTYGDAELERDSLYWLGEVSRLQARLGTLRMWKSGFWVGLTGVIVAYIGNDWGTFTSMQSLLLAAGSIAFAGVTNRMYWAKDPPPY